MVTLESSWPIAGVGAGRKDYSARVEIATVPMTRSFQARSTAALYFLVPALSYMQTSIPLSGVHFISNFYLTTYANVLIGLEVLVSGVVHASNYGYQECYLEALEAPAFGEDVGYPLSIRVYNYSDQAQLLLYSHFGITVPTERVTVP